MPAEYPRRKPNRLPLDRYVGKQFHFATICTHHRKSALAQEALAPRLIRTLAEACEIHRFLLYAYCFMPDHVHLEVVGLDDRAFLLAAMRTFKGRAVVHGRKIGIHELWQKGFHDHVLRQHENVDSVAEYIFQNPVRKGLVRDWIDWPYSGSGVFDWKKLRASSKPFVPPWKGTRVTPEDALM